jgi:hypothetical protein
MEVEVENSLKIEGAKPEAEPHELKIQAELNEQFHALRQEAKGLFDAMKGRRGAYSEGYWQKAFMEAKEDYTNGKFLLQRLGADRHLDLQLFATLSQLRSGLLQGIDNPTAGDQMLADTAVIAYRNILRLQGWIGSTCLIVERELFGQEPISEIYGAIGADSLEKQIHRLENILVPLLDRCQRMFIRALDRLEARRCGNSVGALSIARAGQVNVGSAVQNS